MEESRNQIQQSYYQGDEITLKELILKLKEFFFEVTRNWGLIVLFTFPLVIWFLYKASITPLQYKAELTFMVNEEEGGGGLASLIGQLGFNVGGDSEYNRDKIVSLSQSGRILYPILLDSVEIEGVSDLVGNHLIRIYNLHKKWKGFKSEELSNYYFGMDSLPLESVIGNLALKQCYGLLVGAQDQEAMFTCSFDEKNGILKISSLSPSEELSYHLTNEVYNELSSFYIKQQAEPKQRSFNSLKMRADSLHRLIQQKEYELANLKDATNGVYLNKHRLRQDRLRRELPGYAGQYATLLKNLEQADFLLKNSTPVFQVIDYPMFPLTIIVSGKIRALAIGVLLGIFLGVVFVVSRKIIRDALLL